MFSKKKSVNINLMKKLLIILTYFFSINNSSALHETEVSNEVIATLGGVWVQIYVYEQHCADNQYYTAVIERLEASPRFKKYSSEIDHLTDEQELAWERGGAGAGAVISSGGTDCDTMATVIWEWFGEQ
tara:strand:+ start:189 stop:575 length:387 start_codon:yes stop_codon:yes gene_type:complete